MSARGKIQWLARAVAAGAAYPLLTAPASAQQTGPLTTQSLFFNQASTARGSNYVEIDSGVVYTDNIFLEPSGPGGTLGFVGLVADTSHQGSRLDWRLDSDMALVKYFGNQFGTQPFGYLDGEAVLKIVPGFFTWNFRDSYSQATLQPFAPITPDNLEAINYATTGPTFTLRPTLRTTITLDGIYAYTYSSSKSPLYVNIDNHRYGGSLKLERAFTGTTSAFVRGSWDKVQFKDTVVNNDFTQEQVEGGLNYQNARTVANASVGYVRLHEEVPVTVDSVAGARQQLQTETATGTIWNVDLSRLISPTQRVSVHALQQVADASNLFQLNIDQPVPTTVPNRVVNGQPLTDRNIGASWRWQQSRTSFQVDLYDDRQRYQNNPIANRDAKVVSALVARQLNPVLNWDVGLSYEHDDYAEGGHLNTINAITDLRWQLGQRFGLRFVYAHSSTSPNGYQENEIAVIVSYALTPRRPGTEEVPLEPIAPLSSQQPYYQATPQTPVLPQQQEPPPSPPR